MSATQRLAKWRTVFAGWQLGTRAKGDPESDAVRDHREITMLMRAELNALVCLMVEKRVFTAAEFTAQLELEAEHLSQAYQKRFPGFKATDQGLEMNVALAQDTMKGWRP